MALVEGAKKGRRYTQKEREERRMQVHQLHFDEKNSAVEIAEILNVNRNTISEDIKFWSSRFVNRSNELDVYSKMNKQIQRMEIQRDRFLIYLEEAEKLKDKVNVEKLIFKMDNRLTQFFSKVILKKKYSNYGFQNN